MCMCTVYVHAIMLFCTAFDNIIIPGAH